MFWIFSEKMIPVLQSQSFIGVLGGRKWKPSSQNIRIHREKINNYLKNKHSALRYKLKTNQYITQASYLSHYNTWIILSPGCNSLDAGPSGCTLVTNMPLKKRGGNIFDNLFMNNRITSNRCNSKYFFNFPAWVEGNAILFDRSLAFETAFLFWC